MAVELMEAYDRIPVGGDAWMRVLVMIYRRLRSLDAFLYPTDGG